MDSSNLNLSPLFTRYSNEVKTNDSWTEGWTKGLTPYTFPLNSKTISKIPTWRSKYELVTMLCKKANPKWKMWKPPHLCLFLPPSPHTNTGTNCSKPGSATCKKKILEYRWHFFSISYEMVTLFKMWSGKKSKKSWHAWLFLLLLPNFRNIFSGYSDWFL